MNGEIDFETLGRRALAAKRWRWFAGMRGAFRDGKGGVRYAPGFGFSWPENMVPDLTDPATLGGLLALVREAWGEPMLATHGEDDEGDVVWTVRIPLRCGARTLARGASEAEVLVIALELAP